MESKHKKERNTNYSFTKAQNQDIPEADMTIGFWGLGMEW